MIGGPHHGRGDGEHLEDRSHILETVAREVYDAHSTAIIPSARGVRPPDLAITEPSFLDASANLADSKLIQGLTFMFPNSPGMESHTELH